VRHSRKKIEKNIMNGIGEMLNISSIAQGLFKQSLRAKIEKTLVMRLLKVKFYA
jgi:hypothetical protein